MKNTLRKVVELYCLRQLQYDITYFTDEGFGIASVILKNMKKFDKIYCSEDNNIIICLQGYVLGHHETNSMKDIFDLYMKYGKDFVQQIDGAFNIIMFNKQTKHLNIYNDCYAFNKLYYKEEKNGELFFGTNIKSILLMDKVLNHQMPEIDEYSLFETSRFGHFLNDNTLFSKIKCLPFASNLFMENKTIVKSYWVPKFNINKEATSNNSKEEIINAILFSMKRRFEVIGNHEEDAGISLSGGLDSRMIAAAAENIGLCPQTYSYGDLGSRDLIYAKETADKLGLKNLQIRLDNYKISHGRKFAAWQCEGEIWNLGPIYHRELIKNNIKYKITGICGGDVFLGGHLLPFMFLHKSELKLLERVLRNKTVIHEDVLKVIFRKDYYETYTRKVKAIFLHSFNAIDEDAFYKKYEIWEYIHRETRGIFSNNVDRYYFTMIDPYLDKKVLDLWLTLPLRKKILQIYFKKALLGVNKKTRDIPYALTDFKVRGNLFNEVFSLGVHGVKGRLYAMFKKYYHHPGKDILDVRQQIINDLGIRQDIECFLDASYFPKEIFNKDKIKHILTMHYNGNVNSTYVLMFILKIATVYEYFIMLKPEIPTEVASFADELFMP